MKQQQQQANKIPVKSLYEGNGPKGKDLSNDKNFSSKEEKQVEFYCRQGMRAYLKGDFIGALTALDRALQIKPNTHITLYNKGLALANLGRHEAAIVAFDQALQIKPDYHYAWLNLGLAADSSIETSPLKPSSIALKHSTLMQRSYKGELAIPSGLDMSTNRKTRKNRAFSIMK